MRLALDVLCQLVLFYETFKALKAAPAPRKRRKANEESENVAKPSSHEMLRRRRVKTMLKVWVIYIVSSQAEKALYATIGRWLPLYGVLRLLCLSVYIWLHKQLSDQAFSAMLTPALRLYERVLDPLTYVLNEVLDISVYIIGALLSFAIWPFVTAFRKAKQGFQWLLPARPSTFDTSVQEQLEDTAIAADGTTPKPRRRAKPRLSQMATPHAPGHLLIAADDSHASMTRRDMWPEASTDSMPAFREALDRAQAAFYEAESPESSRNRPQHLQVPGHPPPFKPSASGNTATNGHKRTSQRTMTRSSTMQALGRAIERSEDATVKRGIATPRSQAALAKPPSDPAGSRETTKKRTAEIAALVEDAAEPAPKRRIPRAAVQLSALPVPSTTAAPRDRQSSTALPARPAGGIPASRSVPLVRSNSVDKAAHAARQSALAALRAGRGASRSNGVG